MEATAADESEVLSHEEEAFYSEIRGLVVVFLFFVILSTIAHLTLQYFAARPDPDIKQDRADRLAHQLVFGICTFTLTISLTGYSLLPFSIAANEVLLGFPQSYYVQWLDTDLVKDLSLIVNLGTKISCLLLPFSYFLLIAQGFSVSPHAFSSRFVEAVSLLVFAYILVFGTVWSAGSFVASIHSLLVESSTITASAGSETTTFSPSSSVSPRLPSLGSASLAGSSTTSHPSSTHFFSMHPASILVHSIQTLSWYDFWFKFVLHTLVRMLESVQLVASLFGLVLLFACTPIGLVSMGFYLIGTSIQALPTLTTPKSVLVDRLAELHFSCLCLEDDLCSIELLGSTTTPNRHFHPGRWYDRLSFLAHPQHVGLVGDLGHITKQMAPQIHAQLPGLRKEIVELRRRMSRKVSRVVREWSRSLIPCFVFGLIFLLLQLMQSYVFLNILELAWNLLFGPTQLSMSNRSSSGTTASSTIAKLAPTSLFGADEHPRMTSRSTTSSFTLGHKPVSVFGHVGAVLQICVIHFLLLVSLWGFYATPTGSQLRPRAHSMNLESVMANVSLLLLFSSALPLQSNLLGLTTMTLPSALKTKEPVPSSPYVASTDPASLIPVPDPPQSPTSWWTWSLPSLLSSKSPQPDDRLALCIQHCHPDAHRLHRADPTPVKSDKSGDTQPVFSSFWHIFVPISIYPSVTSYWDWTGDSLSSSNGLGSRNTPAPSPVTPTPEERSLWTQFISRAFGVSSPTSPASCGLIVVILLYNLCFLITSVWIAGRHLSGPTWSFSLELVTSLRCVQQLQWTGGSPEGACVRQKENYAHRYHPRLSSIHSSTSSLLNGASVRDTFRSLTVENED